MNPHPRDDSHSIVSQRARPRRPDAYIVSADDAFLLELGPALGDRFRTRPVEHPSEIQAQPDAFWLAFVDAARSDARALVAAIEKLFPQAPVIVVVPDGAEAQWSNAVTRGTICAVVGRGNLAAPALQEAVNRAERRLDTRPDADPATSTNTVSPFGTAKVNRRKLLRAAAISIPVLALAAIAGWWVSRGTNQTPPAAAAPTAEDAATTAATAPTATTSNEPPAAAPARSVLELLSAARVAFQDQDRLLPRADGSARGASALELYAQALQQEPQNEEALDGLRRLFAVARSRMQSDLGAGRLEEAQRMLAVFKSAGLEPDATRALEADIAAARPKWLVAQTRRAIAAGDLETAEQLMAQVNAADIDRATRTELERGIETRQREAQLVTMGDEVHTAIAAGALLEPAATSARTRVLAMRQINRTHAATVAAQRDLQVALLARSRDALRAQQFDSAQRLVSAAGEFGNSSEVLELRRQIQSAQELAAAPATPAVPTVAAPVPAEPTPATPSFVSPRPLRALKVTYPRRAADTGQQGYAIVEFTLNPDGTATDIAVPESQPSGVFDRAATDAVKGGQFDTSVLGTSRQPQRARLRLTFKPS